MRLYKTVDNDNMLRLEEENGAAITVALRGKRGSILSLLVPEEDRGDGIGSALVSAAEGILYDKGIRYMEADYSGDLSEINGFFEKVGFEVSEGPDILSVETKHLLSAKELRSLLKRQFQGMVFVPLDELVISQWDELMEIFSDHLIGLGSDDMNRFAMTISGVVYDFNGMAQAVALCTEYPDSLHIDFLAGFHKDSPQFLAAAIRGMAEGVVESGSMGHFHTITMLAANDITFRLLDVLLGKERQPDVIGSTVYAVKKLSENNDFEVEDDLMDELEDEWRREIKRVTLQNNIGWKSAWKRTMIRIETGEEDTEEEDNKAIPEENSSDFMEEDRLSAPDEEEREAEDSYDSSDEDDYEEEASFYEPGEETPRINFDPFEVEIDFDKEEEETDGLTFPEVSRITDHNLEDYMNYFSPDDVQNLVRPYYRGLVAENGEDPDRRAVIVWELKNVEDDKDIVAKIDSVSSNDRELSEKLLTEYKNEVLREGATESVFEIAGLQEEMKQKLREAGFSLAEGEGIDVRVRVDEISKTPFARMQTPEYVQAIGDLSVRQFKRGIANCLFNDKRGICEDLAYLPMEWFDRDISSCVITDERPSGFLLVHRTATGRLLVDLLFLSGGDSRKELLNMIAYTAKAMINKYPGNTEVILRRHNQSVTDLVARLFPGGKGDMVITGNRREEQ